MYVLVLIPTMLDVVTASIPIYDMLPTHRKTDSVSSTSHVLFELLY